MSTERSEEARWFAENVEPHDSSLRAYLRGAFPTVRDLDDVVQESYVRVWRTRLTQPIRSARAFLFQVARHLALDIVRRNRISPIESVRDLNAVTVIDDGQNIIATISTREKVRLLAAAIDALPPRCRQIIILRKLQCVPQKQVAAQLGLAEKTIEAQVARGEALCEEFLRRRGVHNLYGDEAG